MSSSSRHRPRLRDWFGVDLPSERSKACGVGRVGGSTFRAHRPGFEEFLEEMYDRSAETCDLFENASEVNRYCVTCTVCRHFEAESCPLDAGGHDIVSLLNACHAHDDPH